MMLRRVSADGDRVPSGLEQTRVLAAVALWPMLAGYAAIAAVFAIVVAITPQAHFSPSGILLSAAPGWLAAYQVPIGIGAHQLGLLPLGATIGVCVLVARAAGGAAERLGSAGVHHAVRVIAAVAGSHAVVGVTIAIVASGSPVTADPLVAFLLPALISAVAATVGLVRPCGLHILARDYVDDAALAGLRPAAFGLACLVAVGALVVTAASMLSAGTMHSLFEANADGVGSGIGMVLLSIAYLPNAILAGLSFAVGPGFSFGAVWASPIGFDGGSVPAVPLLAAVPDGYASWWPLVFVLPAVIGIGVGWMLRHSSPEPLARLRSVTVAASLVGFACVLLGTFAGGQLGSGPFVEAAVPVGVLSISAFAWIALPGGLVAFFAGARPTPPPETPESDAETQEPDPETEEPDPETEEPDVEDQESDVEDQEPDVEDQEPAAETEESDAETEEPDVEDQEPDVEDQEPDVEDQESAAETEESDVEDQEPDVEDQEPDVEDQEPAAETEEPDVEDQESDVEDQEPDVEDQEPDVEDQEPNPDTPEPNER